MNNSSSGDSKRSNSFGDFIDHSNACHRSLMRHVFLEVASRLSFSNQLLHFVRHRRRHCVYGSDADLSVPCCATLLPVAPGSVKSCRVHTGVVHSLRELVRDGTLLEAVARIGSAKGSLACNVDPECPGHAQWVVIVSPTASFALTYDLFAEPAACF